MAALHWLAVGARAVAVQLGQDVRVSEHLVYHNPKIGRHYKIIM
jgi:hypothetical protein